MLQTRCVTAPARCWPAAYALPPQAADDLTRSHYVAPPLLQRMCEPDMCNASCASKVGFCPEDLHLEGGDAVGDTPAALGAPAEGTPPPPSARQSAGASEAGSPARPAATVALPYYAQDLRLAMTWQHASGSLLAVRNRHC